MLSNPQIRFKWYFVERNSRFGERNTPNCIQTQHRSVIWLQNTFFEVYFRIEIQQPQVPGNAWTANVRETILADGWPDSGHWLTNWLFGCKLSIWCKYHSFLVISDSFD